LAVHRIAAHVIFGSDRPIAVRSIGKIRTRRFGFGVASPILRIPRNHDRRAKVATGAFIRRGCGLLPIARARDWRVHELKVFTKAVRELLGVLNLPPSRFATKPLHHREIGFDKPESARQALFVFEQFTFFGGAGLAHSIFRLGTQSVRFWLARIRAAWRARIQCVRHTLFAYPHGRLAAVPCAQSSVSRTIATEHQ